ncbi:MAG: DUF421 domain-containing protein [Prochloraceae cyanobacterium]
MLDSVLLNSWSSVIHTVVVGSLGYLAVVILLRVSGKRTLSKWNSFDFVVTIAFGSILASLLLSTNTSLVQGVVGFGVLVFWQFLVTRLSHRYNSVENLIKTQPRLLLYKGQLQTKALKQERVTEEEIRMALRSEGIASIEEVDAIVLETNGSFSVIKDISTTPASALLDVKGYTYQEVNQFQS